MRVHAEAAVKDFEPIALVLFFTSLGAAVAFLIAAIITWHAGCGIAAALCVAIAVIVHIVEESKP